jgi:uncharacterized membrane protein YcaP (DUF421 family)
VTDVVDWFRLTVDPVELVVRGTLVYLSIILVTRFLLRRDVGSMSMADILFIVLVADAAQNAMSAEYRSLGDGAVLVGTLVAWNVALDWMSFRWKAVRWLVQPPAVKLIQDGKWMRRNLKREWITTDEVLAQLREAGIADIGSVKVAYLESSGQLGIIKLDEGEVVHNGNRRPTGTG